MLGWLAAAVSAVVVSSLAWGQGSLPAGVRTAQEVSASDERAMGGYFAGLLDEVGGEDYGAQRAAREELLEAFEGPVSVAYRLSAGEVLRDRLEGMVVGGDAREASVALLVAGRIATASTLGVIEVGMDDARPAVRYAAAMGARELLGAVFEDGSLALPRSRVRDVVGMLTSAVEREDSPRVVEGVVRALANAGVREDGPLNDVAVEAVRGTAVALARKAVSVRRGGGEAGAWAGALLRGVEVLYREMLDQQIGAAGADRGFAVASAELAGQAIALVRDAIPVGEGSGAGDLRELAESAETLLVLSHTAATGGDVARRDLGRAFDRAQGAGDAGRFEAAAGAYIGPRGVLRGEPYNMSAGELD